MLHALATPGVLLDTRNGGFALATPVGLALAALFTAASALEFPPGRAEQVLRAGPWLRSGIYTLAAVWGIFSLAGLPPLRGPGDRGAAQRPADRDGRPCPWCSTCSSPSASTCSTGGAAR